MTTLQQPQQPKQGAESTNSDPKTEFTNKKAFERLPKTIVPAHYNLRIQPHLKNATFDGQVEIHVQVNESTNFVTVDCAELEISEAVYIRGNGKEVPSKDKQILKEMERIRFEFGDNLPTGKGILRFKYTGVLNDKLRGFYRNVYTVNGEERYGACTQFESCFARQCLPCWDEPAFKATFDVTMVVDKHMVALSNMPVKSEEPLKEDAAWKVVKYDTTPIMSSYLLALVVGEFDFLEDKTEDDIVVRVYTPLGKKEQGQFALDFAVKTLPYYREFFSLAYPLPKCDLIAIQNFAMGAMENWGCITFRETALLVDTNNSSAAGRQRVALVVGHELAHMWFGNIVTMEWWTELWLNEGFASFVEHISVEKQFPDWKIWHQFVDDFFSSAMKLDALNSSHPIEVPVGHPDEVEEIFDAISYEKGASVIRMLYDFLGEEGFKAGLSKYLQEFEYKNATTKDLWRHFEQATGKPVSAIMSDWTMKKGYPVVSADLEYGKNGKATLLLSQKKFSLLDQGEQNLWSIPMTLQVLPTRQEGSKDVGLVKQMFDKREDVFTLDNVQENQPVLINTNLIGFYRVQYSEKMLRLLIPHISSGALGPLDRMGIQNDLMALVLSGDVSVPSLFELWRNAYKSHEKDPIVWQNILTHIGRFTALMSYTDSLAQYQQYTWEILVPLLQEIGWGSKDGKGHLESLLRESLIDRLVKSGHPETVKKAQELFEKYLKGDNSVPTEIRRAIFIAASAYGGKEGYEKLWSMYEKSELQEEKVKMLVALGWTQDPSLHQKTLDAALSKQVRSQDVVYVLAGCAHDVDGRERTWQWIQKNWEALKGSQHPSLFSRGLQSVFSNFCSEEKAQELEAFLKSHKLEQGERAMDQAMETIRIQAQWLRLDGDNGRNWLQSQTFSK